MSERNEGEPLDEARQLQAAAQLPADVALLKMENDQIFSLARMHPRDSKAMIGELKGLIEAYPEAADEAIYSKPVGTVMSIKCKCGIKYEVGIQWKDRKPVAQQEPCPDCGKWAPDEQKTVKKYAEGLSIRAAESIRSIFGYTRLSVQEEMLEDGKVKLRGVMVDYAAGNITADERTVSPYFKARSGHMVRTPEDRFLNVVVKAEKAKLRRDVILDTVPNIVKAAFRGECERVLKTLIAPEVVKQKIIPEFQQYGIGIEDLGKLVGRSSDLGWRETERLELRKILSALKNGETTKAELLDGLGEVDTDSNPAQDGPSTGAKESDLTNPKESKPPEKPKDERKESEKEAETDPAEERGLLLSVYKDRLAEIGTAKEAEQVRVDTRMEIEQDKNLLGTSSEVAELMKQVDAMCSQRKKELKK